MLMKISVFWDMAGCGLVYRYQRLGEAFFLHNQIITTYSMGTTASSGRLLHIYTNSHGVTVHSTGIFYYYD
jgi:hypothetical protein